MPPCSTCADESRCDRAGLCQAFKLQLPQAVHRPAHGGYPEGGVPDAYSGPGEPHGVAGAVPTQRERDFEQGWRTAAEWAQRDDLLADIGSEAYNEDRAAALSRGVMGGAK